MTDHWNQHSINFGSTNAEKKDNESVDFQKAEGNWDENKTGFTIDTVQLTETEMGKRRDNYAETNPSIRHLQQRQIYTNEVRNDRSYRFLMMVAAFSKKKLGTVKGERGNGNGLAQRWVKINQLQRRSEKSQQKYMAKSHNIFAGSGNKKFDMNMQNAKTKLPKSVPY